MTINFEDIQYNTDSKINENSRVFNRYIYALYIIDIVEQLQTECSI
jgi:hypothetical protein